MGAQHPAGGLRGAVSPQWGPGAKFLEADNLYFII